MVFLYESVMVDAVQKIQSFNAGRDPERLQIKYRTLRASAFSFLRGTCHLFYDRLAGSGAALPPTPLTWVCGDLHVENFGSYKADNRLVYFDINDFDESALAPAGWDLVRLLASLQVGVPGSDDGAALCRALLDAYAHALTQGKAYWVERETAQGLVRQLLDSLRIRRRVQFLDERTERVGAKRRLRVDGKHALPATQEQCTEVKDFMAAFALTQPDPKFYKVLDVARCVAGTGSLGLQRYTVLVRGKGSPDQNYLLDLKQALPSSLLPHLKPHLRPHLKSNQGVVQPRWKTQAHRVVDLQNRLQAVPMAFLQPVLLGKTSFVLRSLQPAQDRVALDAAGHKPAQLRGITATLGQLVAWAQLRSAGRAGSAGADEWIAFGRRKDWQRRLLAAAQDCARQVQLDWAAYATAFDDGALSA